MPKHEKHHLQNEAPTPQMRRESSAPVVNQANVVRSFGKAPAKSKKAPQRKTDKNGPLTVDQLESGKTYVETTSLLHDVGSLLLKIIVIALLFVLLFTFVFGVVRQPNGSMSPAINDGDALLLYHLDKEYVAGDVVVVNKNDTTQALRVIAVEGDVVDITQEGLFINGNLQSQTNKADKTEPFKEGITFPLTVGSNEVFLLGDTRSQSTDSRIFGCVDANETQGTVISLLRRRNI